MSRRYHLIAGLDVGTHSAQTVLAEYRDPVKPHIIGVASIPTHGMYKGEITDAEGVTESIRESIRRTERMAGVPVDHVYVSIAGEHIQCRPSRGVVAVSRADGEISHDDVRRVLQAAQALSLGPNRELLHVISRSYTIDGEKGVRDPVGMHGVRLEVDTIVLDGSAGSIRNLRKCVESAGVDIREFVVSPLAAARAVLSKRQRELGVLLLDIGGGVSSMGVFEEGDLFHTRILPIGSAHITNDLAIGLRTALDVAERVKLEYGSALSDELKKGDTVDLSKISEQESGVVSRKELAVIISARLEEIFEVINKELKRINREALLPAGVVLLGGGAKVPGVVELAKRKLRLPVQLGFPSDIGGVIDKVDDPAFATAVGLIFWGMDREGSEYGERLHIFVSPVVRRAVERTKQWLRTLLP
ncbi:MAG: cell division protein FtsA [Parcubacteria group bacterium]|nr:cell division protein FtsA [Parcubacteria group bacterium]